MTRISIALLSTLVAIGCHDKKKEDGKDEQAQADAKPTDVEQVDAKPKPEPEPEPEPEPDPVKIAIASVTMVEDCPDPDPPPPPPEPPAEPEPERAEKMDEAAGDYEVAPGAVAFDGGGMPDHCEQSAMQLSLSGREGDPAKVKIEAVRLLQPSDKSVVAELKSRVPMAWDDGTYEAWDETLKADTVLEVSYKLSVPNWSEVERKIGNVPSAGHMFVIEVDISVGGVQQTVTSSEFARREPEVIVT